MATTIDKDLTLSSELAFDDEKDQEVVILYTWENVFADGTFTYAKVFGKKDYKVYSTDFRNLTRIEID